ncbi:hypothetical protein U1E44_07030 [Arenibacter sp. GZD96]|uniref:hypothetical protein n=1 Tax=Aurantibrevibacter litoralis TaxID=3106030 RepID=UPI002AFEA2FB|nr:hypothetical protein [Arenibacter sp. GZD-96]MEA1785838.1 hypothetical protein [Arenibacter sp. GZD-96]
MKRYHLLMTATLLILMSLGCSDGGNDGDSSNPTPTVNKAANLRATGASANDILSNTNFTKLQIEIGYVTGFRPTDSAIEDFVAFLRKHTFKNDIEVLFNELPSPGKSVLTLQEIADLETENRTAYNNGQTLAVYIYFADAPSDGDDEESNKVTLGAVYRNTSMVIYERTIRRLAARSFAISNSDAETATLNHEFGHLFGLVNLGTVAINDHEDPEAANHCIVDGCLMRAELRFGAGFAKFMESRSAKGLAVIPELDPECVLDLQGNGGR